jgi:hypothetical protein
MWANLTSLVHQLLQQTVMEDEETLSASLAMAGTLAGTATTMLQANSIQASGSGNSSSAGGAAGKAGKGSSVGTAVLLLEFAVQLLDHTKQQAAAMEQQHQEAGDAVSAGLTQQLADIQQQVRIIVTCRHVQHDHSGTPHQERAPPLRERAFTQRNPSSGIPLLDKNLIEPAVSRQNSNSRPDIHALAQSSPNPQAATAV